MTQAISSLQELSGAIGGTVENLQELSGFSNSSPKQNLQYIYGHTYWIGVCSMSWNNLKKLREKHENEDIQGPLFEEASDGALFCTWETFKRALKDNIDSKAKQRIIHCRNFHHRLKIGDHLSEGTGNRQPTQKGRIELLEQRMDNMEAMSASLATLEQRVYDIEKTQGPTQGHDFEDIVTELRLEIEDLSGQVVVLTRAFGNAPSGGVELTRARVPEPRAYDGARDAKELDNFLFDMQQYFKAVKADAEETRISMATMYLSGDAKLWWRTKHDEMQRGLCTIETWEQLKHELKLQFFLENVEYNAQRALRDLKHTGTIRDYVKEFYRLMLDIKDMLEKDKLFFFLEGLKPWARVELQRQRVQDLAHAQATAEYLTDYAEPKQRDSSSPHKSSGGGKSQGYGKPKSGRANTSTSKTHSGGGQWQQKSYGDKAKAPQQFSTSKTKGPISCFLCNGPHRLSECPQKCALNALAIVSDHVSQRSDDDSEEEDVRSKRSGKGSK
ncbi:unnamed protein product [Camellia sinensis]